VLSYFPRLWALAPGGMLRRNHLISDEDMNTLARFLDHFDVTVARLLDGATAEAFANWPSHP
jgi:hypothetical protein